MPLTARDKLKKRAGRTRAKILRTAGGKPRLSVFRSSKHIYAQVIDDKSGETLVSASSLDKTIAGGLEKTSDVEAASVVGRTVAERAIEKGVSEVVFDRGGYIFHGRVKAVADAARDAGLKF